MPFTHTNVDSPVLAAAIENHLSGLHHELVRVLQSERILAITGSSTTTDAVIALELIAIADRIERSIDRILNEEQRRLSVLRSAD